MATKYKGIRSVKRNFLGRNKKNNEAINEFLATAVGCVTGGSRNAMVKVAQRGLATLVKNGRFSDYTGAMRNSYQAAILDNGKFIHKGKDYYNGDFSPYGIIANGKNVFRTGNKRIRLMTSYGMDGTIPIQYPNENAESIKVRRQVNPLSSRWMHNYYKGRERPAYGYGRYISHIQNTNENGISVVFDNPTPYAEQVHTENKGSQVYPIGVLYAQIGTYAVTITQAEIKKSIARARDVLRKRKKK